MQLLCHILLSLKNFQSAFVVNIERCGRHKQFCSLRILLSFNFIRADWLSNLLIDTMFVVFQHLVKPGSYTWKYHRPPPPRPRSQRTPPSRSNIVDMDAFFDMFEDLEDLDFSAEDLDFEDLTPLEMAFVLMQLGCEANLSSDEENYSF